MALCFIMMSGRIGAIVGSNYTGALIDGNCNVIFILNASILLSKFYFHVKYLTIRFEHNRCSFQLAVAYATSSYKQRIRSKAKVTKNKLKIWKLLRPIRPK